MDPVLDGADGRIVQASRRKGSEPMSQGPELSPIQPSMTRSERGRLARYQENLVREIRSGAKRNTGRFWTMEELQAMADELKGRRQRPS